MNYVDPNGEAIFTAAVLVGAAIGAVIGGSAAAYQCSKYGFTSMMQLPMGQLGENMLMGKLLYMMRLLKRQMMDGILMM